jgi:predicted nucleotidyltransferase component of viral defense system
MNETAESGAVREALQARLLVELMGNSMHKELVLKGGLAMRAVHGSVRYTKDIDLDADLKHSKERVQGIVARSISRAVASGLIDNAKVSEPKQTETTLRWKINGNMPGSNAPLQLTVEVSRRASMNAGHVIEVPLSAEYGSGVSGAKVRVLDSQAIAVTKVMALTDPKRMAPRDLYDLHVLIKAEVQEPTALLASLPSERLQEAMVELWPKIEGMTYQQFRNEVVPYLPAKNAAAFTEDAFAEMQLTVGVRVQSWLEAAERAQAAVTPPGLQGALLAAAPATAQPQDPAAPARATPRAKA